MQQNDMKKLIIPILLLMISIFPLMDLFHPGLPVTHDGQDHVARIANFYQSLTEGNPVPRWAGNLNWGYGHPILMFLYPLPSYLASLFHFIGLGLTDSTKLVFGFGFTASVLAMYLWLSTVRGKIAGFIGAILYGFAPYRFVDLYVRGALGEHLAFIFPPLVMYFIYVIGQKIGSKRVNVPVIPGYAAGLAASVAGLILSHNAISLMFLPVFILYGIYNIYLLLPDFRKKYIFFLTAGFLSGFGLAAFFWVPAFFEGKYTLRDIVTAGEFNSRFVPWSWFFNSPWNYGQGNEFTKSVGQVQLAGLILSVFLLLKTKIKKDQYLIGGALFIFLLSIFLMTDLSGLIWQKVTILQKFQFPWRFLSVSVFTAAVLGGIVSDYFTEKLILPVKFKNLIIPAGIVIISLLISIPMWKAKGYSVKPDGYYSGIYAGTTDTGESSPVWSIRFMEKTPKAVTESADGEVVIKNILRNSVLHQYVLSSPEPVRMIENTLYFPGWEVRINGVKSDIQFQDPLYRGLITYQIPAGTNQVSVRFANTRLRSISDMVSLIFTIFILSVFVIGAVLQIRPLKNKLLAVIK
jgi:hypothetical protein